MRNITFTIFFSIVLVIYTLINYYIFIRGWRAIPVDSGIRPFYRWGFIFLASSYIIARILERVWLSPVSDFFTWVGSFWLGFMFYFFLAVVVFDILRLLHFIVPVYPWFFPSDPAKFRFTVFIITCISVSLIMLAGFINAFVPRIKTIDLTIPKHAGNRQTLNLAMASDIHMGTLVGPRRTKKMANLINSLKPDLVVFAGDMVDEELAPVLRFDLGRELKRISAPLGVYAVTGNHEYIGGVARAKKYLEENGITMLSDTAVLIDSSFYLAGREDRTGIRFGSKKRKELGELLDSTDLSKPVIMLDHQPFDLNTVAQSGVDLQLSGHTHHGQLWPLNYVTNAIYEISAGLKKIGKTWFYVSSGYGGWGPPVRTNSCPEVVLFRISFTDPK
jgi:hypothetical protein